MHALNARICDGCWGKLVIRNNPATSSLTFQFKCECEDSKGSIFLTTSLSYIDVQLHGFTLRVMQTKISKKLDHAD
jgi:hypothetical protein